MTPAHPASGERSSRDLYITPEGVIEPLLEELEAVYGFGSWEKPPRILDPGAGTGVLTSAIRKQWPNAVITAIEINPEHGWELTLVADEVRTADFVTWEAGHGYDLVLGNPPFSLALPFLERALELPAGAARDVMMWGRSPIVGYLLNFNFLGSDERVDAFQQGLDAAHTAQRTLAPRPSFTGGGADSTEYAWQLWRAGELNPFGHYLWRITDKRRKRLAAEVS